MLKICAWCDPEKTRTNLAIEAGIEVTHGVCFSHGVEQLIQLGMTRVEAEAELMPVREEAMELV